jgi:hypothetical protein
MFRRVHFECQSCGEGFVDWHDDDWERSSVFCVSCGEAILPGAPLDSSRAAAPWSGRSDPSARALGVLKSDRDPIRDTIPGLPVAEPERSLRDASESTAEQEELTQPSLRRGSSNAASTAPRASSEPVAPSGRRRQRLAYLGAMLLGFAIGTPLALLTEDPLSRLFNPAAHARAVMAERSSAVSSAIDEGRLDDARSLLQGDLRLLSVSDQRLATLRARLALGFVLANRASDADRELAAIENVPHLHPAPADVRRIHDALSQAKPSAVAASAPEPLSTPPAAAAPSAKPVVTKRELLSFARDRQRRVQLDDAERLYREVLRTHPNDAEARCGLAEIELLRGGVEDGQKLFARALQDNARYAPAWVGLADVDWLSGHTARAACRYQAVIDRFPAGSYPPYIAQRVAQAASSGVNVPRANADAGAANACSD